MKTKKAISALLAAASLAQPALAAPAKRGSVLTLSEYLEQVSQKNQGIQAADLNTKAAKLEAGEGTLIYKPQLVAEANTSGEGAHNPLADNSNTYTRTKSASVGIQQATRYGVAGKLSYGYNSFYMPATPVSTAGDFSDSVPKLEVTVSLIRNFLGSEIRAQSDLATASSAAKAYSNSFYTKSLLLEAESTYWRLALAREMVEMQKDAVERAQKMQEWTKRRLSLQLTDRAEKLAVSTNLQARRLDLRSAQDEARAAAQAFNASRGTLSDTVSEKLVDIGPELITRMDVPARSTRRDDLRASEYQAKAAAANSQLAKERNKPTLEIFGSGPLTTPAEPQPALAPYLPASARSATVFGVKLVAPLDVFTQSKVREGYAAEALAADWSYQRKVFEEERDWQDLISKFDEAKDRFRLYNDLERTQKEKLDYERDRQQRGRSTLQQVLLFENDYALAQLGRLRTLAEVLTLNAQMKLYGVQYESR